MNLYQDCLAALKQIKGKKYDTELIEKDIRKILKLSIVFKGKEIKIVYK